MVRTSPRVLYLVFVVIEILSLTGELSRPSNENMTPLSTGWTNLADRWPTPEMVTRATLQNFLVGLPIAFFSGLGVAVSVLDDSTSSLVGVAISASLLPPAVNSGILWVAWGFAANNWLGSTGGVGGGFPSIPTLPPISNRTSTQTEFVDEDEPRFPDDYADQSTDNEYGDFIPTKKDFRTGGIISLCLTLANIVLVIIASIAMFRYGMTVEASDFDVSVLLMQICITGTSHSQLFQNSSLQQNQREITNRKERYEMMNLTFDRPR